MLKKLCQGLTCQNLMHKKYFATKKLDVYETCERSEQLSQKVAFNIASEASYVYILSGQKLIKNENGPEKLKLVVKQCYQTGQKLVKNAIIEKLKCGILSNFQTL